MENKHAWSEHGYIFAVAFGVVFASLGRLFIGLSGISNEAPLKDLLGSVEIGFFLLILGAISAISYTCALSISRLFQSVVKKRN